jgi:hypothetical protein
LTTEQYKFVVSRALEQEQRAKLSAQLDFLSTHMTASNRFEIAANNERLDAINLQLSQFDQVRQNLNAMLAASGQ